MRIDVSDGSIWSDCFFENDWAVYHSDSIHRLEGIGRNVKEREEAYIEDAIHQLEKAGWEIVE